MLRPAERASVQSAANGGSEPILPIFYDAANGCNLRAGYRKP
jgi:hypothetical protein